MRSINTPPRNGTTSPGSVTTITCQLTATVECVADMMYQLTPIKFIPLPNSETNIAVKKYRNPRCCHSSDQSTRCVTADFPDSTGLPFAWGHVGGGKTAWLFVCQRRRFLRSQMMHPIDAHSRPPPPSGTHLFYAR